MKCASCDRNVKAGEIDGKTKVCEQCRLFQNVLSLRALNALKAIVPEELGLSASFVATNPTHLAAMKHPSVLLDARRMGVGSFRNVGSALLAGKWIEDREEWLERDPTYLCPHCGKDVRTHV